MTIFIIGDSDKPYMFNDAEMVISFYGHIPLNPTRIPEIWTIQEAMLDVSDALLLLKGWEKSPLAVKQYNYAKEDNKHVIFYSAKSERTTREAFKKLEKYGG